MQLSSLEWSVVVSVLGLLFGVVTYFLKRTMGRTDRHEDDINMIKREYTPRVEVEKIAGSLRGDIKALREEQGKKTQKLTADVEEIKANYLTKSDFLHAMSKHEQQLDRILDYLMANRGGGHGQQ